MRNDSATLLCPTPAAVPAHEAVVRASSFAIDVPQRLLARARSREASALEQLYRWFERPVFTLALRLTGCREDAAEVLQETMLKLLGRIDDYRGGGPFWGWLRQIAVNESLMRLRRSKAFELPLDAQEDAEDTREDLAPPPPEAADAALLQRALLQLPAATRSVLWLYHAEGFTHEEIGTALGRTTSFSKSQLARGTRRLRDLLKIEGHGHD